MKDIEKEIKKLGWKKTVEEGKFIYSKGVKLDADIMETDTVSIDIVTRTVEIKSDFLGVAPSLSWEELRLFHLLVKSLEFSED